MPVGAALRGPPSAARVRCGVPTHAGRGSPTWLPRCRRPPTVAHAASTMVRQLPGAGPAVERVESVAPLDLVKLIAARPDNGSHTNPTRDTQEQDAKEGENER